MNSKTDSESDLDDKELMATLKDYHYDSNSEVESKSMNKFK